MVRWHGADFDWHSVCIMQIPESNALVYTRKVVANRLPRERGGADPNAARIGPLVFSGEQVFGEKSDIVAVKSDTERK